MTLPSLYIWSKEAEEPTTPQNEVGVEGDINVTLKGCMTMSELNSMLLCRIASELAQIQASLFRAEL